MYLGCHVKQDGDRVVGLLLNEKINIFPPPYYHPALIDDKRHQVVLLEHRLDSSVHLAELWKWNSTQLNIVVALSELG